MNGEPLFMDLQGVSDMRTHEIPELSKLVAVVLDDLIDRTREERSQEGQRALIEGVANELAVQMVDMSIASFKRGAGAALEAANQRIKENSNA